MIEQASPIYVDISSAVHGKAGLGRYASSLVQALQPQLGERLRLFCAGEGRTEADPAVLTSWRGVSTTGAGGPAPAAWQGIPMASVRLRYKPWRALVYASQLLRWPMNGLVPGAALFHATEHLLPSLRVPTVMTVHDLIYERFPEYHKRQNYLFLRAAMPLFCRRATAIIAVSQATKADLVSFYKVEERKITVIPEAAAPHFCPQPPELVDAVRRRYGLPPRYLLALGVIEPRKNLQRLLDACGPLFAQGLADGLVLVGRRGWLYEGFFQHLESLPYRGRVQLTGHLVEEDLPAVLAGALITVQPSLYEGFGLPVLEAMACGSPVCASCCSSLPEVGADAARYFHPEDTAEMTEVLREVILDAELRAQMRARGLARAAQFSWQRTAAETVALYSRLL